jgi:DNA-binding CsgD family transcriptional regulator
MSQARNAGSMPAARLASLDPAERQILDRICAGEGNSELSAALGLTEEAVKNLMATMLPKLG